MSVAQPWFMQWPQTGAFSKISLSSLCLKVNLGGGNLLSFLCFKIEGLGSNLENCLAKWEHFYKV